MKSLRPILISACFFVSVLNLSAQEIYSRVKIFAPNDNVKKAELIGLLEIDHFNFTSEGALLTEISASELTKLKTTPYKYQILVPDVKKELEELNANYFKAVREGNRVALEQPGSTISNMIPTPAAFEVKSTFGGYYSFAEMETAMNQLVTAYPAIASKTSLTKTVGNRDLWMIKISDNVASDEANEPEVLYLGLQHAREAITGASMIFFMQYLCENYATDTRIKNLIDNREIFIVPCFNPDGWEYNRTNGGAGSMWRKNRSKVDSSKQGQNWNYTYGVDLNRNWGVDWSNCSAPILGSSSSCGSSTTSSDTYYGSAPFSEKETKAIKDFAESHHLVAGFDQHAYGPYYSLPFGRKSLHPGEMSGKGQNFYTAIPAIMGAYNGMRAADSYDALGYEVAGGFKDWMLMGNIGTGTKDTVWAMTGEGAAGGGTSGNNFWAPASQIVNLSKGMCYQNLQLAFSAGTYVDIQDVGNMDVSSTNGNFSFTLKRIGIGNDPITVSLVPLENIQSGGASVTINSMPEYYDTVIRSINYTLRPGITNGNRIKYAWKIETAGYTYSDTIIKIFNPIVLFSDNMEGTFSTNWSATSNVTDGWEFTSLASYQGSKSMTESPAGNYTSSTTRTVVYKNAVDLSDNTAAYLSFWTKHRAENFRDKLQLQISTNSTNGTDGVWSAVVGSTTIQEPGTLDGATLNGQPAMTGIRDYWTKVSYDLSSYKSSNVRFRFVFTSDGDPSSFKFEKDDGFYIDDVQLLKSTSPLATLPVTFKSFTATLLPANKVRLYWVAETDQEHDHFEIERSTDGFNFINIGTVAEIAPYQFIDQKAAVGYNYYRIKQFDKNGKVSYSKTATVYIKPVYTVTVFPNPVHDNLHVTLGVNQPDRIYIELKDLQGRSVFSESRIINSNSSTLSIDMKSREAQVYILQITNYKGEIITTTKVSKL